MNTYHSRSKHRLFTNLRNLLHRAKWLLNDIDLGPVLQQRDFM